MQLTKNANLKIERLGINGEGIGYLEGYTVFAEGALPEEEVTVCFTRQKKTYAKAKVEAFLSQSKERITPPCPVFSECGGCQIMHLKYEKQLEFKRQLVIDALERIGKLTDVPVLPCLPSPKELSYRNKIQIPLIQGKEGIRLGLYAKESHDLVDLNQCFIHSSLGEKVYRAVHEMLTDPSCTLTAWDPYLQKGELRHLLIKSAIQTKEVLVIFVSTQEPTKQLKTFAASLMNRVPEIKGVMHNLQKGTSNAILGPHFERLAGNNFITETLLDLNFKVSPASFFQVNPWQAAHLYTQAIDEANLTEKDVVLDAYCGVGTLSLIVAKKAKKVIGIECVKEAIDDAKENAANNQIVNAFFYAGLAEKLIHTIDKCDVAFINPPRKGCDPLFLETLMQHLPKRLIYISCDPATLARDLSLLSKKYRVKKCTPLDMFPQTSHVETVASLEVIS